MPPAGTKARNEAGRTKMRSSLWGNRAVITTLENASACTCIGVIDGWKIVDRIEPYEGFVEQNECNFREMLKALDEEMPFEERLGDDVSNHTTPDTP